jgi:hypothetical protein
VINDLEARPLGVDSLEFDDEGVMEISFVTIRPASFSSQAPARPATARKRSPTSSRADGKTAVDPRAHR